MCIICRVESLETTRIFSLVRTPNVKTGLMGNSAEQRWRRHFTIGEGGSDVITPLRVFLFGCPLARPILLPLAAVYEAINVPVGLVNAEVLNSIETINIERRIEGPRATRGGGKKRKGSYG